MDARGIAAQLRSAPQESERVKLVGLAALLIVSPMLLTDGFQGAVEAPARGEIGLMPLRENGWAYVPASAPREQARVIVLPHGAGGDGRRMIEGFRAVAEAEGLLLVAPKSMGRTWDMIEAMRSMPAGTRGFRFGGGDSARIQRVVAQMRQRAGIVPEQVVLAGFSDGASFALSLGPAQPALYDAIVGFSPGFIIRPESVSGRQPVFISHGRSDPILSFAGSGERVVAQLRLAGHRVAFHPFDGGHFMPREIVAEAFRFVATVRQGSMNAAP
jgi:predicted esterase